MRIKELTNEEFMEFTNQYPEYSVFQTPEYAMVMNKQKYDTFYLGMVDDYGKMVAASLFLVELLNKFQYAYAPRGFLINYHDENLLREFTEQVRKFLKKKNIMAVKISPMIVKATYNRDVKEKKEYTESETIFKSLKKMGYYHLGYNRFFEAFKPRFEAVIPLYQNTSIMFQNIRKEFRTKIRMSDRNGIRIYKGSSENLSYFYQMTKNKYPRGLEYFQDAYNQYQKRGMVDIYFALLDSRYYLVNAQKEFQKQTTICEAVTEEIFKNQGKANNKMVTRKITEDNKLASCKNQLVAATSLLQNNPDGVILACAMIVRHRKETYLLMDGYVPEYKHLNAKHLLIWKLMEKYALEGYETFNLGGIADPTNPENYKGLNDFRLGFGANAVEYLGDFELIGNKALYTMYRNTSPIRNLMKK